MFPFGLNVCSNKVKKYMPKITAMNFHRSLVRTVDHAWSKFYGLKGPGGDTRQFLWDHMATCLKFHKGFLLDICSIFFVLLRTATVHEALVFTA